MRIASSYLVSVCYLMTGVFPAVNTVSAGKYFHKKSMLVLADKILRFLGNL